MNQKLKISILSAIFCTGAIYLTSCGDDNGSNSDPTPPPTTPETPSQGDAMTPREQKQYLEKVAIEFMGDLDAYNFNEISDLGQYVSDTYSDYDWDNVAEWAEDIFDDITEDLNKTTKEFDDYGNICYYDNYKTIIMASNFQSKFKATNGYWVQSNANNLQFIFSDKYGQECVLKLETSGNVKKVYVCNIDDWYDYDYNYDSGRWTDYYDRTQLTIGVPEKIIITLTQGAKTLLKNTLNINLASISNEKFDLSKSQLTIQSTTELDNGYSFVINQISYTSQKAAVSFAMNKDGKSLVSATATTDINDIPALKLDEFSTNLDDDDFDDSNAKNCYIKLDILGKVQIQGSLSDCRKFADYMELADENYDRESTFKSYVNQANELTDINLFYNGSSTKQASCYFEAFEDNYYGYSEWYVEPVIKFYDGTSYSTFEAFFNDVDFKKTVNTFENLIDDFADLID